MSIELNSASPLSIYLNHLAKGELAYQYSPRADRAVFYPRVVCPYSGSEILEWRVSAGRGTVYAATTVRKRDHEPYNISLIDCIEGFRLMTRVEGIPADEVHIGMRVRLHVKKGDPPLPIFYPERVL